MSTILDSLKKSSDQRNGNDESAINNFYFGSGKKSSKMGFYLVILILLALTAGIMYWGYKYLYSEDLPVSSTETVAEQNVAKENIAKQKNIIALQKPNTATELKKPKPDSTEVKQKMKDIQAQNNKKISEQSLVDLNRKQPAEQIDPTNPSKIDSSKSNLTKDSLSTDEPQTDIQEESALATQRARAKEQIRQQKYLFVYQLPFSIRKDIPKLTLNIHVYDEKPENCIAIINGVRFEIDDMIEEHVLLKDIILEGVVLDIDGIEFLIPK
ncbi:MAG: general secretion pathway protein GspB [Alcanivoracaceae bacterium]|nr:general secretion pathway protein GspB [Alcanivoracaceae bacterium]